MPFKSRSQQRKFFAMARTGEIPKSTAMEWAHETQKQPGGFRKLPEKVRKKKHRSKAAAFVAELSGMTMLVPGLRSGNAVASTTTPVDRLRGSNGSSLGKTAESGALSGANAGAGAPAPDYKLLERLLPAVLLGTAGAGYGAMRAPGKSRTRGALIGGLTGAGAGLGMTGAHEFLKSPYGEHLGGSTPSAATLLGGTAAGAAGGLAGGRRLSKWLGLGSEKDKTENDLRELDVRLLPGGLRDYVKHAQATPVPVSPVAVFVSGLLKQAGIFYKDIPPRGAILEEPETNSAFVSHVRTQSPRLLIELIKQSEQLSCGKPSKPKFARSWMLDVAKGKSRISNGSSRSVTADKPADKPVDKSAAETCLDATGTTTSGATSMKWENSVESRTVQVSNKTAEPQDKEEPGWSDHLEKVTPKVSPVSDWAARLRKRVV